MDYDECTIGNRGYCYRALDIGIVGRGLYWVLLSW